MKKPLLFGIILTVCVVIVAFVFAQVYPVGMISYWKFDEGSETTAFDSADANDGTIYGATWTTGQVGGALSFNGVNDYVTVPSNSLSSNPMTISWWMNTNDMRAALFLDKNNWDDKKGMEIWLYNNSSGYGYLNVRGSGITNVASSSDFHGEWVHVAVVFDGTTVKIYRNGAFDTSGTIEQIITSAIDIDFVMGMLPGLSDWYLDGILDEVAIFCRALTAEEIQHHYQDGLHGLGYDVECVIPPEGLVSWWDGDAVSETTAFDIQNGNDGKRVGGVSFVPGRVGDAFTFTGSGNDYVRVPNHTSLEPASVTVDAWVRADSSPGSSRYIVAKGAQECKAASYALYTRGKGLHFYVFNPTDGGRVSPGVRPEMIWDGNWHHIAGTYDGSSVRLYVDGAEVGSGTSTTISIGYGLSSDDDLIIGQYTGTCSLPFIGEIDEVEIFNRALEASEIQDIYLAGSAGKCTNQPPVAVCKDIEIPADENCQASIVPEDVDGGSSDPDEGDTITFSVNKLGPYALGKHDVTLTVTDESGEYDTCQAKVTVNDTTPPVPDVADLPDVTGECSAEVTAPTATDNCAGTVNGTPNGPLTYTEQGTFTVTWTYDDGNGNTATQTQTVVVKDTTPPEITSVSVSPDILRPPNHKMVNIIPDIVVSDNCDSDPTVVVTSVEMNEGDGEDTYHPIYDSTLGAGHTTNDIQMDDEGNIWNIYLRAERSGKGTGRIYIITYTATDASGNSATATATVTVPHDK